MAAVPAAGHSPNPDDALASRERVPARGRQLAHDTPVQLEPGAPGYDGLRAAVWLGLGPADVFAREPVDAAWAGAMEREMTAIASEHLTWAALQAKVTSVACHTASCAIVVEVSAADRERVEAYFQGFIPLGDMVAFDESELPDGGIAVTFTAVYSPASRSPSAFRALIQELTARAQQDWAAVRQRGEL